jgi:sugar phosphate isomerase/epimerase
MEIMVQTGGLMRAVGYEKGSLMLRDAGFTGVDWNIDGLVDRKKVERGELDRDHLYFKSTQEILDAVSPMLEPMLKQGLHINQAHAPFPPHFPGVPELYDYAVEMYVNMLPFCQEVGIKNLVLHGISWNQGDPKQPSYQDNWDLNVKMYEALIPQLVKGEMKVCLENLFYRYNGRPMEGICSNLQEAQRMVDHLNAKAGKDVFGFCVDTGHLNLLNKSQSQFIGGMGKRVACLHIHDNNGHDDEHLCPYTGNIDWDDFIVGLRQAQYRGDICFETFRQIMPERVAPEVVPAWLRCIHDIGETFRDKVLAE